MTQDSAPQFEFTMRATGYDRSGYYYPNWDRAEHLTVRAATKQEAYNKGAAMLGRHPRHGSWTFVVDKIKEVPHCRECADRLAAARALDDAGVSR